MPGKIRKLARKAAHRSKAFGWFYEKLSGNKTKAQMKMDDETFFRKRYKEYTGKKLDLDDPKTLNEKMLWLQLHDRRPEYTMMSDKYLVKEWVAKMVGSEHVVPLIGVWDSVDDIPFDDLPDEYVLKCNHDCGSVIVKRAGETIDVKSVKEKLGNAMKRNYYYVGRVWGYKDIVPKVFAEKFIRSIDSELPKDYKFFCFNGEPKIILVNSDRGKNTKSDFYDVDWNRYPVKHIYPNTVSGVEKPAQFEEMMRIARTLSAGIPHVRVDMYIDSDGTVFFGEMTFCSSSGKEPFEPEEYDRIFGEFCDLTPVREREKREKKN